MLSEKRRDNDLPPLEPTSVEMPGEEPPCDDDLPLLEPTSVEMPGEGPPRDDEARLLPRAIGFDPWGPISGTLPPSSRGLAATGCTVARVPEGLGRGEGLCGLNNRG